MKEYRIKLSEQELDIIIKALKERQEALRDKMQTVPCSYWNLSAKEKLFWIDKSSFDKYYRYFIGNCCNQIEDAHKIRCKLNRILGITEEEQEEKDQEEQQELELKLVA